jgi:helix-turn-helix protein
VSVRARMTTPARTRLWSWVDAPPAAWRRFAIGRKRGGFARPLSRREVVIRSAIGAEVARLRTSAGWPQWQLADRLFLSQPEVSNLESGRRTVDVSLLWDRADVFGVEPWHFVAIAARAAGAARA